MTPRVDNTLKALWIGVPVSENENRMIVVEWHNSIKGLPNTSKSLSATVVGGGSKNVLHRQIDYPQTFWSEVGYLGENHVPTALPMFMTQSTMEYRGRSSASRSSGWMLDDIETRYSEAEFRGGKQVSEMAQSLGS
ncbi:hypothetical protein BASA81_017309 [Batrachochytrium salamandrivorans]|nr:hypothetical protein BASA81_017309 [Batrachochytrium salamandrivorans]